MVGRNTTGAHYGLKDWLVQRVTAVVMAAYIIIFAAVYFVTFPQDYFSWSYTFQSQWMRIATLLFFLSLFWHAWVGVRDIYMDYIKPTGLRLGLQVVTILVLIVYAMWMIQILWSV
ncbi:succinate dehydrogenase, hydrophobic membrane anchor protein [Burkholderiales bacterium]|nr:succinate dehydrogenase, hydrophobic membrane anchor protein [Burkholderiales bacterium]